MHNSLWCVNSQWKWTQVEERGKPRGAGGTWNPAPKTSLKPNTREVMVGSSPPPAVDGLGIPVVHVSQEVPEAPSEDRGLVAPEAIHAQSLVLPQGLPMEVEV